MTLRANGIKKSLFPIVSTIADSDRLDFISSGVNYSITYGDFVAGLGVTGSIVPDGALTGTPILDVDGTVNNIRNLEAGAGIVTSVSAENGALIRSGIIQDGSAVPLFDDVSLQTPTIASLIAGVGIGLVKTGNRIEIKSTATPTNRVLITELADFPTPISGNITLAANTCYVISGNVDIGANELTTTGETYFQGCGPTIDTLTTTTTGSLFNGTGGVLRVDNLGITCANGSVVTYLGGGGGDFPVFNNVIVYACDTVADIGQFDLCLFNDFSLISATTGGIVIRGANNGQLQVRNSSLDAFAGIGIDLLTHSPLFSSVFIGPQVNIKTQVGSVGIALMPNDGNLQPTTGRGVISGNILTGLGTQITGSAKDDVYWEYRFNSGIGNTEVAAQGSIINNATATVIGALLTPVQVAYGGGFNEDASITSRFTVSSNGRFTYDGLDTILVNFNANIYGQIGGGTIRQYTYFVYKNGVQIASSNSRTQYNGTTPDSSSVSTVTEMSSGDYLEIWVQQDSGALQNVTVNTDSSSLFGIG